MVAGEREKDKGQRAQHNDVNRPVERNEAEYVTVAQQRAPQGELDLIPALHRVPSRTFGDWAQFPVVAAEASMPAHPSLFSDYESILWADVRRARADANVTPPCAGQQLVAVRRPALRPLRGGGCGHGQRCRTGFEPCTR